MYTKEQIQDWLDTQGPTEELTMMFILDLKLQDRSVIFTCPCEFKKIEGKTFICGGSPSYRLIDSKEGELTLDELTNLIVLKVPFIISKSTGKPLTLKAMKEEVK